MIGEYTEEQASLYLMGMLPPDEARAFETAIAADPKLAELMARLETGAAAFASLAPPLDPPPALRGRIMAQVRQEAVQPGKIATFLRPKVWLPWAIAACLAVIAGALAFERHQLQLLLYSFKLRDQTQQSELDTVQQREVDLQTRLDNALFHLTASQKEKEDLQSQLDGARAQMAEMQTRDELAQIKIAALASLLKNAPQAMAVVAWDGRDQRGILKTVNMPAPGPDQDYQLWIIDPGYKQPVSAGVFNPATGEKFQPVQPISKAGKFAVSLEKKGGSPAPQGPIVLMSEED